MPKSVFETLNCPNCHGEVELDKEQEYGFCKYCGTKLQNTNFKIVKGNIKIDREKDYENYLIIARRALNDDDYETAERYYDMMLQINPNSYEALFYKNYCNVRNCKIIEIRESIAKINNCLESVFRLMKTDLTGYSLEEAIKKISIDADDIIILLVNNYKNFYDEIDLQIRNNYNQEYIDVYFEGKNAEEHLVDLLLEFFADIDWVKNNVAIILSNANELHISCIPKLEKKELNINLIHERTEKIKKYNPNYVEPAINKGGCYVATSVYGSYDCPQVWTLRRYRDKYLASTWHGKIFIHVYYAISPTIVKYFGKTKWFKKIWKSKLDKMVGKLIKQGYESTPYNDIDWY